MTHWFELPERWKWVDLKDVVADEPNAIVDGPFGSNLKLSDYVDEGVPVLQGKNITNDRFVWKEVRYISDEKAKELNRSSVRAGDILVVKIGSIGYAAIVDALDGHALAIIPANLAKVTPNLSRIDRRYLFRWLTTPGVKSHLQRSASKTAQPALSLGKLKSLPVPLPPLPEQRRIADILDKADAIRRKRKEAIALTEELLRSAFLEMFGDPVTNPKGWEVKPLGTLLAMPLRNGLSPASGGAHAANVLTLSAITRGRFDGTAVKHGAFAAEPWDDVRVDERDFLICRGNGNLAMVGTGAFPSSSDPTVVFPDTMIAARVDETRVSHAFLTTVWKSGCVRRQIEAGARTTNGTFKVNQTLVESVSIPVPGLRQQRAFDVVASQISKLSGKLGRGSEHASNLFDSLLDRAFRGELTDTNGAGKPQIGLFNAGGR